jgi:PKHD-type hydroxylase
MFLNTPYYIKEEVFSKWFCDGVITQGDNQEKAKAVITHGDNNNRKSNITWLKNDSLIEKLTPIVNEANENSNWNFLLREFEPLQYTVYNKDDHYDWHIDSHGKSYDNGLIRKLSFTLFLNEDYEGGDFRICEPHPNPDKITQQLFKPKTGTMVVFPSFVHHKVSPVTRGVRKTLVGWIVGKPFV